MVLVDIENMAGTPTPSRDDVISVMERLNSVIPELLEAQTVVACSHQAAPVVVFTWRRARHLWRSGKNGADLALLEVLVEEQVHEHFDSVTLCSGDGSLADVVGWLGTVGVEVNVISLEHHLSKRLRLAARTTRELPIPTTVAIAGESA